jgi:Holliday junction resolvase RusA-like endonuclease
MTQADRWKQRPCVLRYRAFADMLRLSVGVVPPAPIAVEVVFHLPVPKSRRKGKSRIVPASPHLGKPDADNLVKAVLDALFEDDSGVWRIVAEKRWTYDEGRIELRFT